MKTQRTRNRALACVVLALGLGGCGDDGEQSMPLEAAPQARDTVAPESTAPRAVEEEAAPSRFEIDRRSFNVSARDPFTPPLPRPSTGNGGPGSDFVADCDREIDPLGFTDPDALRLEGLVTGTAVPRAMFYIPGSATAIFVSEGAKIGPNCRNEIIDIRDNEVLIRENSAGEMASETTLVLTEQLITRAEVTEDP